MVTAGISPSQSHTALLDHCWHTPSCTAPLQAIKFTACHLNSKRAQTRKKRLCTLTIIHFCSHKALPCSVYCYKDCYVSSSHFVVKGPMKWLWDCTFLLWCDVFLHETEYWWVGKVVGRAKTTKWTVLLTFPLWKDHFLSQYPGGQLLQLTDGYFFFNKKCRLKIHTQVRVNIRVNEWEKDFTFCCTFSLRVVHLRQWGQDNKWFEKEHVLCMPF